MPIHSLHLTSRDIDFLQVLGEVTLLDTKAVWQRWFACDRTGQAFTYAEMKDAREWARQELDRAVSGLLTRIAREEDFTGKEGQQPHPRPPRPTFKRIHRLPRSPAASSSRAAVVGGIGHGSRSPWAWRVRR